jgi:hypothetical protein
MSYCIITCVVMASISYILLSFRITRFAEKASRDREKLRESWALIESLVSKMRDEKKQEGSPYDLFKKQCENNFQLLNEKVDRHYSEQNAEFVFLNTQIQKYTNTREDLTKAIIPKGQKTISTPQKVRKPMSEETKKKIGERLAAFNRARKGISRSDWKNLSQKKRAEISQPANELNLT